MKENKKELLVEGNDDLHVILALCEKYRITENFKIVDSKGFDKLIPQIPIRFKSSGIETIGIIVDADADLKKRWDSVCEALKKSGFNNLPKELTENGLIINNDKQKAGVWIMPNNKLNGMLEDFISFLIPSDDKLYPIVQTTLQDIETKELNIYKECHKAKARIHTWLAWQEDPGTPMGLSITKRYLTTDEDTCMKFVEWLKELFS